MKIEYFSTNKLMHSIFLDTEFTGLQQNARLISIALFYSEDQYFYAELNDIESSDITPWVRENVLVHLEFRSENSIEHSSGTRIRMKADTATVKTALEKWLATFDSIEIWGDVLAYDWILFCNIFGGALHIPKNIFYIPFDLPTLFKACRLNPDLNRFDFISELLTERDKQFRHHALMDARVGKLCLEKITSTDEREKLFLPHFPVPF